MEQFNLEEWLKDKSRKICTRDGRLARIVCWDLPGEYKIIGITAETDDGYTVINKKTDGTGEVSKNDLFFADEEELTEFEKAVRNILVRYISNVDDFPETIKSEAKSLLDLARKELKSELDKKLKEAYNQGGLDTQEEITKCLPKWKKNTKRNTR